MRPAGNPPHSNYHLGQVLHAGGEPVVIDFDGEPGRPLYGRRLKHSPLYDIAAMVRSFHYAAHAAMRRFVSSCGSGGHRAACAYMIMLESEGTTENIETWRTDVIATIVNELGSDRVM